MELLIRDALAAAALLSLLCNRIAHSSRTLFPEPPGPGFLCVNSGRFLFNWTTTTKTLLKPYTAARIIHPADLFIHRTTGRSRAP